jgi:hypothetical protein
MRRITINTEKCQNEAQIRYVLKEELKKYKDDWEKHGVRSTNTPRLLDGLVRWSARLSSRKRGHLYALVLCVPSF